MPRGRPPSYPSIRGDLRSILIFPRSEGMSVLKSANVDPEASYDVNRFAPTRRAGYNREQDFLALDGLARLAD